MEPPLNDPSQANENRETVTGILRLAQEGDEASKARLLEMVYQDLKAISANQLARERGNHTLQPTALVHEAYLKLVHQDQRNWTNRAHFFAIASRVIRNILVDHARTKNAKKREAPAMEMEDRTILVTNDGQIDLLDLDEALKRLAEFSPEVANVVELRFFGELSAKEVAQVMGSNETAVARHWTYARAWLKRELTRGL